VTARRFQAAAGIGPGQIAAVTRQKSTARRLVSSMSDALAVPSGMPRGVRGVAPPCEDCAVLEDMHQMLFKLGVPVIFHRDDMVPIVA
jgi:hypothetical protein